MSKQNKQAENTEAAAKNQEIENVAEENSKVTQEAGEETPDTDSSCCEEHEAEIEELRAQLAETEDAKLRLTAEFDNFRKRSRKEKERTYTNAKVDLVKNFLPLLDGLDHAYETLNKQDSDGKEANLEGIKLLIKQGQDCLASLGVEEIACEDANFDPELHEAVQHIEDDDYPENSIIEVLLKGYKAGDTVIRHSVVRVAN